MAKYQQQKLTGSRWYLVKIGQVIDPQARGGPQKGQRGRPIALANTVGKWIIAPEVQKIEDLWDPLEEEPWIL